MAIRFDKEDDLFLLPTIVICKVSIATNIHIAWLHHSIVFIISRRK